MDKQTEIQPSVIQAGTGMLRDTFLGMSKGVSMLGRFFTAGDHVAEVAEVNAESWRDVSVDRAAFKRITGKRQLEAQLEALDMSLSDLHDLNDE